MNARIDLVQKFAKTSQAHTAAYPARRTRRALRNRLRITVKVDTDGIKTFSRALVSRPWKIGN